MFEDIIKELIRGLISYLKVKKFNLAKGVEEEALQNFKLLKKQYPDILQKEIFVCFSVQPTLGSDPTISYLMVDHLKYLGFQLGEEDQNEVEEYQGMLKNPSSIGKYPRMQNPKPKPLKEIGNISVGDTYEQPRPTSIRKPTIINYKCFTIETDEFGNGKVLTPGVLEKRRRRRRARFLVFGDM